MPKNKRKLARASRLRTMQVDPKSKSITVTSDHPEGMYLRVVIKDNKGPGEVVTAVRSPGDVGLVETAITRMVRQYLRSYPLAPPQGFYSLLVMPKWVSVGPEVRDGRE